MKKFEYKISSHPAETFEQIAYFCSEKGDCTLEEVPSDQINVLENILNARGQAGWELVDIAFGKDGLLAFWKKEIS